MAGIKKEPGYSARRVAEAMRRIRRSLNLSTVAISQRLEALEHPIADTGIIKAEHGTRRVDVDDLIPICLALGVTPNRLLLPEVDYLGGMDWHLLTPSAGGTPDQLWQWAQGEMPLRLPLIPGGNKWIGDGEHPALEFSIRNRPYLTAMRAPGPDGETVPGVPSKSLRALSAAVADALAALATPAEVRRIVELTIAMPAVMSREEIQAWMKDRTRPDREGKP